MEKKAVKTTATFSILCILSATLVMIVYMIERSLEKEEMEETNNSVSENKTESVCPFWQIIGDGYCDDEANIEECGYDFGDCCHWENDFSLCQDCFCKSPPINYTDRCNNNWYLPLSLGDGICDRLLNNQEFFFDAGDCCYDKSEDWSVCVKSDRYCIEDQIGDGICQDHNNSPLCDHDLGDCCVPNITTEFCCDCHCSSDAWIILYGTELPPMLG